MTVNGSFDATQRAQQDAAEWKRGEEPNPNTLHDCTECVMFLTLCLDQASVSVETESLWCCGSDAGRQLVNDLHRRDVM